MEFSQLAIRHGVWVDADYCAALSIQFSLGVLDRSIVCMIDGKYFFYPSTVAPQFRRGPFPCMGMAIAAGVFALVNSMALQYSNLQSDGRMGSRRKEFRWMLVHWQMQIRILDILLRSAVKSNPEARNAIEQYIYTSTALYSSSPCKTQPNNATQDRIPAQRSDSESAIIQSFCLSPQFQPLLLTHHLARDNESRTGHQSLVDIGFPQTDQASVR
jgi:hypothetical protein